MFMNADALPLWCMKEMLNALFHGIQGLLKQGGRGDAEVNDALVEGSAGDRTKRTESYVCFEVPLSAKFMDTAMHKVRDYAQYTLLVQNAAWFWFI
jgi:hypothetical protein